MNTAIEKLEKEKSQIYNELSQKDDIISQLKAKIKDLESEVEYRNKKLSHLSSNIKDINEENREYQKLKQEVIYFVIFSYYRIKNLKRG
jgi:predicted nuclease with TOPRIM domain